jgi:hypothetical protein
MGMGFLIQKQEFDRVTMPFNDPASKPHNDYVLQVVNVNQDLLMKGSKTRILIRVLLPLF